MLSWQLRLSQILMPPVRMMQGQFAKNITPESLIRFRNWSESKIQVTLKASGNVTVERIEAKAVPAYWFSDNTSSDNEVLLYFHGGGFCFGWNALFEKLCMQLVKLTGISILAVDYRLAPEHRYPVAHEDCLSAYRWLLHEGYAPEQITWMGDSAGAQILLSLMMQLRDRKEELPYAGILLSPSLDLTFKDKWIWSMKDSFVHPHYFTKIMPMYFPDEERKAPHVSPLFGDFSKLPEMLVIVGEQDVMRSDGERFVKKANAANVKATLDIVPGAWHSWYIHLNWLPEARQTARTIADFLLQD